MEPSTPGRRSTTSTPSTAGSGNDPQFYDPKDRDKLLLEENVNGVEDVPRDGNGRAIIPEPRNDENLIIVRFHKALDRYPPFRLDQGSSDIEGPSESPATSEAWQAEQPPGYGPGAERG